MTVSAMLTSETAVQIGSATIPMSDALALYNARSASWRATLSEHAHVESVAIWNAIQRADKLAKGIPVGNAISTPRLNAATARLEAELMGASVFLLRRAA